MPRLSPATRAARRRAILDAARRCFARNGFAATTIADLCNEAGVSAGGIYTHFENKHAIAAAIGSDATSGDPGSVDLAAMARRLADDEGEVDARLDVQLWAESLRDVELHRMVTVALDHFRAQAGDLVAHPAMADVIEALVLGAEVQRALGRATDPHAFATAVERITTAEES